MTFLPQSSLARALATPHKSQKAKSDRENEELPAVEDQVPDHLRNLKVHKPMGPDEMHPWVLKELANEVAKLLSIIFKKSWHSSEVPTDWKRRNMNTIFEKEKKEDSENHRAVSLTSVSGVDPSGNSSKAHGK
ncbi:rna-directed dna polymerase from mobile element hypothetical protein [Limosa lapponica baueri]|uniref:Rna-directed dna polymerase from mobile element jockey-like n=1 Tax=Limosa lapponica baueri TaxID=1758121 RepID=A0A2I0U6R2_LIMLA|nr:rna-directed dna polymerase from mobile element hypothetical protein [Limosa lapponica baueri]